MSAEAGKTIDQLELGMTAELTLTYDETEVPSFATQTGDLGMLSASLISAVVGTRLPGPGSVHLAQDLKFLRPVRTGDTVTAKVVVIELDPEQNLARLMTTCANQKGERLLEGTALVMPPRRLGGRPAGLRKA